MSATAIFVTAIIGAGILVAAGVFTVAWRRGPSAGPVVGEFEKDAVGVARDDAKARDRGDIIAQPVGRQRLAPGRKAEVIKRLDFPPVVPCFRL